MPAETAAARVKGGIRGVAPKRHVAEPMFLEELKDLFWANQSREAEAYENLIYALHPVADADGMQRLLAFRNTGPAPGLGKKDVEEKVMRAMRVIRYPSVEPLLELSGAEGLSLEALTTILHFHHPAYPIYSKALVAGLNTLGIPAVYRAAVEEESVFDYAGVIAALDRLKTNVSFENVPESNCYLTRVVESALVERARNA